MKMEIIQTFGSVATTDLSTPSVKYQRVREHVKEGRVCLLQCDSFVMGANMLTQSVTMEFLKLCMNSVGMAKCGKLQVHNGVG